MQLFPKVNSIALHILSKLQIKMFYSKYKISKVPLTFLSRLCNNLLVFYRVQSNYMENNKAQDTI